MQFRWAGCAVPVPCLDDDRLIKFYLRSHEFGLADLILQAAHEIVDRPQLRSSSKLELRLLYSVLAQESQMREDRSGALEMLQAGKPRWDPHAVRKTRRSGT